MLTEFRYALGRLRGQVIGWGATMFLLALLLASVYGTVVEQQEGLADYLSAFPAEMMAFFGDFSDFSSPEGFLQIEFFSYMPIMLGVYGILAGSGLLVADEEAGRMDFVLGQPVTRAALFWGRLSAMLVATIAILLLGWLGISVSAGSSQLDVEPGALALAFLSLFAVILFLATLALLLSMVLPSRRTASMVSGVVLAAGFFVTGLSEINEKLEFAAKFSPLSYYQGGGAMKEMNWEWFIGLVAASFAFALIAWWRFERRDLRVGGEGGWSLPVFRRGRPAH